MVQGNWERRAELASKRRIEAKQKKAEVTKKNVFESSYNKLSKEDDYSDYRVWLSPLDDRGTCCSSWLRFEMCSKKKKCKLPHVGVGLPELLIDGETSLPPSEESIDVEESNVDTAGKYIGTYIIVNKSVHNLSCDIITHISIASVHQFERCL